MNRPVLWESVGLTMMCTADAWFTLLLVLRGQAVEANPVMAYYLNQGPWLFVLVKVGGIALTVGICEYLRAYRPKFVTLCLRVGFLAYVGIYILGDLRVNNLL